MAKELMEIGGFITSGAEIVNHDASLSGNGTVESPLGVVPGYNETVLWSGNGANEATLSESMQNFSRLKLKLGNLNAADGAQYFELPAIPGQIKNLCYYAGGGGNFYLVGLYCSATDTSITITKEAAVVKPFGSTAVNGQNTNAAYSAALHEVIGINRKAQ